MKKKTISILFILSVITTNASAQSIWNLSHLTRVKQSLFQPVYDIAYKELIKDANTEISKAPLSVMMKEKAPIG